MQNGIKNYQVGDKFSGFMLIKEMTKGVTSTGKDFLTLILRDTSGEIEAKLWDARPEDMKLYQAEVIIYLTGEITQFRGKAQLKIYSIRPSEETDGVHIADFVEKAPVEKEVLFDRLKAAVLEMQNLNVQEITRAFITKYKEELLTFPAAVSNHHAYVSGLAHHITSMLALAREICKLYPELNKDLLYAGIILHDLGKVKELSGLVTTSYTLQGKLIGHIPLMVEEIGQIANELNIEGEEVIILQHLVLSHHGKAEWGSPRPPLIREAEILHLIDLMDAKMNMLNRALEHVDPGEFTERLFPMDNRSFYKPTFEPNYTIMKK